MARPKKIKTDVMGDDVVEVKAEEQHTISEVPNSEDVVMVDATPVEDVVPALNVQIVKPKVHEDTREKVPTPICDIEELSDSDKEVLIEKRIKAILDQTQIPYIPAIVRFREPETTAVPPMYALVDFDHRFVDEGWKFYQTNVKNPYVKDYLLIVAKLTKPQRIFPRLVTLNYE